MSTTPRQKAIEIILSRIQHAESYSDKRSAEDFASHVFTKRSMQHYLSIDVFKKLELCMDHGETLTREIAGPVANAIKSWAIDHGATHFTHWFQPLTGLAAEKHDSFLEMNEGEAIYKFSGDELIQQEPDASSFPHGGLRSTFEARGYTAWDSSSPVFIFETRFGKTLCITTIFVSYHGEALDYKIPLLRSIHLLDEAATEACQFFDKSIKRVTPTLGAEQEYFLIDEAFYNLRPDLILTGRTLMGTASAKDQQLADHYFGSIPERVFAFMNQLEFEAHRLGIPLKTRHNEVAPSQFECAPHHEEINISIDHGLMLMDIIERTARQHKFKALLHEKPFKGINGSGKHNNWSLRTDTGKNLLSPGKQPRENLMFLTFFTSVIRAVYEYSDLLRASIASPGNDLRLGGQEAPPSIISVFIGKELSRVLKEIVRPPRRKKSNANNPYLKLGISKIPELFLDNTDRNRTSPFAFTGNKFEFRAVGSSANSSNAMMVLNVIVADQLMKFNKRVTSKINRGRKKELAILDVIKENITISKPIRFEGDGYSHAWADEARKRGLTQAASTPEALAAYLSTKSINLFTSRKIFTENELKARYEVIMENYLGKVRIESDIMSEMINTLILPQTLSYQNTLLQNLKMSSENGLAQDEEPYEYQLLNKIRYRVNEVFKLKEELEQIREKIENLKSNQEKATAYAERIVPFFDKIREHIDQLEQIMPDHLWPLPKYREMLFIK